MMPSNLAIVAAALLALLRCGPLFIAVPFVGWGGRLLLLFGGAALLLPLFLPMLATQFNSLPVDGLRLGPSFLHEAVVGLLLLFGATLPWGILRAAGRVLDALRASAHFSDSLSRLCGLLALCLYFGGGGASLIVAALAKSYVVAPLPALSSAAGLGLSPRLFLALAGQLFAIALELTLPLVGAWLTALLGLGLCARFLQRGARRLLGVQLLRADGASLPALRGLVELLVLSAGLVSLIAAWQSHLRTLPYLAL